MGQKSENKLSETENGIFVPKSCYMSIRAVKTFKKVVEFRFFYSLLANHQ
jgi:hypothetical protein